MLPGCSLDTIREKFKARHSQAREYRIGPLGLTAPLWCSNECSSLLSVHAPFPPSQAPIIHAPFPQSQAPIIHAPFPPSQAPIVYSAERDTWKSMDTTADAQLLENYRAVPPWVAASGRNTSSFFLNSGLVVGFAGFLRRFMRMAYVQVCTLAYFLFLSILVMKWICFLTMMVRLTVILLFCIGVCQ